MRSVLATCCATAFSATTFFAPAPAQAWGYRHYRPYAYTYYRPYAYAYNRPYIYTHRPVVYSYAYRPFYRPYALYRPYRPYGAYAYAGFGPRIWVGGGRRWW